MARTFQITEIFPELTVRENVRIAVEVAAGYRLRPWLSRADASADRARASTELLDMGGLAGQGRPAGRRTVARRPARRPRSRWRWRCKPRLLLLDEPTAGMGDQETYDIAQLIRRLHRDSKLTIVLIEHDMRVVFHLADRIMVLDQGRMLAEGTPEEIAANEAVQAAYLGQAPHDRALSAEGLHTYLRQEPHPAWRQPRGRRGRDRRAAGPQRRRQDHDAAQPDGPDAAARGHGARSSAPTTTGWPPFRVAALGVGYVPEGRRIFANLTVEENLLVPLRAARAVDDRARLRAVSAARRAQGATSGRQLSGGEQEMLSIARALLLNPQAADPRRAVAGPGAADRARGVPHRRRDARRGHFGAAGRAERARRVEIADRAYVLDDGQVVYEGDAREFGADEERVRALAGASAEKWDMDG